MPELGADPCDLPNDFPDRLRAHVDRLVAWRAVDHEVCCRRARWPALAW
jgi:hypothetical protein